MEDMMLVGNISCITTWPSLDNMVDSPHYVNMSSSPLHQPSLLCENFDAYMYGLSLGSGFEAK